MTAPTGPRRGRTLTLRLSDEEKAYLTRAAGVEAEMGGVEPDVRAFVRWAALHKAEQRLGYSVADFVRRSRRHKR